MKTIRTNCFETNSSSTHSVTIETSTSLVLDINSDDALVDNDILYPELLNHADILKQMKVVNKNPRDRVWITKAMTRNTKAAMLVHYLYSFFDDDWNDKGNDNKKMFEHALDIIKVYCGYADISIPDEFWSMYSLSEFSGEEYDDEFTPPHFLGCSISQKKMINNEGLVDFIQNVIMNPTKTIVDCSEEY